MKNHKKVAIAPFGLRIPPALRGHLEEAAERNQRSLTAEIISRLEESFERDKIPEEIRDRLATIESLLRKDLEAKGEKPTPKKRPARKR